MLTPPQTQRELLYLCKVFNWQTGFHSNAQIPHQSLAPSLDLISSLHEHDWDIRPAVPAERLQLGLAAPPKDT